MVPQKTYQPFSLRTETMHAALPFITMGFTSMLLQITVLRLLLSTFSGNELDIGITLSFWLIYVGLGSFIGKRIRAGNAFTISFLIIALLAGPTALAIKAIRPVLSLNPGEAVSLASTILCTAVILLPLCIVMGIQFPLAVSYYGRGGAAGKVYGLEALGAFIGGLLFTFVISSRMGPLELCLLLSLLNVLLSVYVSGRKGLAIVILIPLIFYFAFSKVMVTLPWQGVELSRTAESRYGEIAVIKVGGQSSVYAGGHLIFSYPDRQSEEAKTHFPMTVHASPRRILVVGGSPGTLKEFLKYPVERIDFIELDPKIIEVSRQLLSAEEDREALNDGRVGIVIDDGRRFIKGLDRPEYDLIVLNLPQPSTASINRFYTSEFFSDTKKALKGDGVLAISISTSSGYMGRKMQTANGSIYNSLKTVFKNVAVTAQEYGGLFASDTVIETNPPVLEERFVRRAITTEYFNEYIFRDAFSPMGMDYVKKRLGETKLINSDLRPSAYLYNLMVWTEIHGGKVLQQLIRVKASHFFFAVSAALLFVSPLILGKKRPAVYCSVLTTGFSGMSFMLVGILAYQALYGYVYEMIGVLSAAFMIGLWTGTLLIRRIQNPSKVLLSLELITVVLAIAAPLFFKGAFPFYVLILLSGTLTGSLFGTANLLLSDAGSAGTLYGIDLLGSFLGSFMPAMVIVPLFGVSQALLFVALMKAFSAVMVLSSLRASQPKIQSIERA